MYYSQGDRPSKRSCLFDNFKFLGKRLTLSFNHQLSHCLKLGYRVMKQEQDYRESLL